MLSLMSETQPTTAEAVFGSAGIRDAAHVRRVIRRGAWTSHTSGIAPDHVQGNVVILPEAWAADFLLFCRQNPKPCPLLAVSDPGATRLPDLGDDLDIRTDVPRYRVFGRGRRMEETTDILSSWRDDLVTFVLGCSFSFERALTAAGIGLRHVDQGKNVAMYRTRIGTAVAGPFHGPLVVSMRPIRSADVGRAAEITSRYPRCHGGPVHLGDPSAHGIFDLSRPDFGDAVDILADETPVFWACGVTAIEAAVRARPDLCITHSPGAMLVTDLENAREPPRHRRLRIPHGSASPRTSTPRRTRPDLAGSSGSTAAARSPT